MSKRGFTLIELLIVVVIVGLLAAIAVPRFSMVRMRAEQAEAGPLLKQICSLADVVHTETSRWPTSLSETTVPSWQPPASTRFAYSLSGDGTSPSVATATPDAAGAAGGLRVQSMDCGTKVLS